MNLDHGTDWQRLGVGVLDGRQNAGSDSYGISLAGAEGLRVIVNRVESLGMLAARSLRGKIINAERSSLGFS